MGFTKFEFTRDWRNDDDFSTVENEESVVRADMQALHNEAKDAVHKLIDEMATTPAAANIGAIDYNAEPSTVQKALDTLTLKVKEAVDVNTDALGSNNITLDKPGEDTLAKAYGLTSLVPTVYEALRVLGPLGAGAAELSKLVDPADKLVGVSGLFEHMADLTKLSAAAQYMEHWWMRRKVYASDGYTIGEVKTPGLQSGLNPYLVLSGSNTGTGPVTYGTQLRVNANGLLELADPVTTNFSASNSANMSVLVGKYVLLGGTEAWYIPVGAKPVSTTYSGKYYTSMNQYQVVMVDEVDRAWDYLSSEKEDAYPKDAAQDGYEYRYIGVPLTNKVATAKIYTGNYKGTGDYGSSKSNQLSFPFSPELVIVRHRLTSAISSTATEYMMIALRGEGFAVTARSHSGTSYFYSAKLTWGEKSLSWSNETSALYQLNAKGTPYHYVAIGI